MKLTNYGVLVIIVLIPKIFSMILSVCNGVLVKTGNLCYAERNVFVRSMVKCSYNCENFLLIKWPVIRVKCFVVFRLRESSFREYEYCADESIL